MSKNTVIDFARPSDFSPDPLTDVLRAGARELLAAAIRAEVSEFIGGHAHPASEKLEIIRLVEGSHLSARQTLAKLGIPRTPFIVGAIGTFSAVRLACRINPRSQAMSGTVFLTKFGARSSSWP